MVLQIDPETSADESVLSYFLKFAIEILTGIHCHSIAWVDISTYGDCVIFSQFSDISCFMASIWYIRADRKGLASHV